VLDFFDLLVNAQPLVESSPWYKLKYSSNIGVLWNSCQIEF